MKNNKTFNNFNPFYIKKSGNNSKESYKCNPSKIWYATGEVLIINKKQSDKLLEVSIMG
jgi:hypothetical protein